MDGKLRSYFRLFFFAKRPQVVLFYRNFRGFQGGHLKTFNYFQYLKKMPNFSPLIYFSENSIWENNPWKNKCTPENEWEPLAADILFLAGLDWAALDGIKLDSKVPIINLIQAIRHADPNDIRYSYLSRRAIRICVSKEISDALKQTQQVNGPIYTIPNSIDLKMLSKITQDLKYPEELDVFISGLKNPNLARKIEAYLESKSINVVCVVHNIPRESYLKKLAGAKISLLLPAKTEGFYLPALESMAVGTLTICPDCIGNRSFCIDETNCLMPTYEYESIIQRTIMALELKPVDYKRIVSAGILMSKSHSLKKEEESFTKIMKNINKIWGEI